MDDLELIEAVIARAREHGITQKSLSAAIGISQPHVSKVLSGKANLAKKTKNAFQEWLVGAPSRSDPSGAAELTAIMDRLKGFSPRILMQFMQIIDILEAISRSPPGTPGP